MALADTATRPFGLIGTLAVRRSRSLFGRYEQLGLIARGGMGGVYLGTDLTTGERVALKVLDPELASDPAVVSRLCAELVVSEHARHPGLLEVYAVARTGDRVPFLVMEYLDGEHLGAIVERGPLELAAVVAFGAQIAAAVAALHVAGIVHCDLKPENVMVLAGRGAPRIKVIDFGVSRFIDEPPPLEGAVAGTPMCMAPEQWAGEPEPATDVYALGCLLFELATGDPPFAGTVAQLLVAHRDSRPPRPSWLRQQLPLALERLILRCLAKAPELRPTMAEVARALAAIEDEHVQAHVYEHAI